MSNERIPVAQMVGQSFVDRSGQRWWVKGPRPDSSDQYIVEAQMHGSYPRVALYVMTDKELEAHARAAQLRHERPGSSTGR